jgi:hypothetical protein
VKVLVVPAHLRDGYFQLDEASERFPSREIELAEYLGGLGGNGGARMYMAAVPLAEQLPPLAGDVEMPPYVPAGRRSAPLLWIGQSDTNAPLHYDPQDNLHALVRGRKRFVLYAPEETPRLYPRSMLRPFAHLSRVDIARPDHGLFPRFRDAARHEVELEEGEILYMPAGWWHDVYTHQLSFGVNFWWWESMPSWQVLRLVPGFVMMAVKATAARVLGRRS